MVQNVSDARSNPNDQIAHAVKVLGKSKDRLAVFNSIYHGRKALKTVAEISKRIRRPRKRVLEEGKRLAHNQLVHQERLDGEIAYGRDDFFYGQKRKILSLVHDKKKFAKFPTKITPISNARIVHTIRLPRQMVRAKVVTVDHIDSFAKIKRVKDVVGKPTAMLEARFKNGIKRILGEKGQFKDWGGEKNDLLTSRLRFRKKRSLAAFAFKGRGKRGKLTPGMMGKNGDQIQRLFKSTAEVFFVQYWDQIDESVLDQMAELAKAKSAVEGTTIYYGIIDGQDSNRLLKAYPKAFR